jgi:transposase
MSMGKARDHGEMEKRRLKAAKCFERGLGAAEVARKLGVRRQSAHEWKKAWEAGGKESLQSSGPAGPKSRLSALQQQQLVDALLEGPQASGYATDVWTLPRVRALISKQTGEVYHASHVSRLLRGLGFSCQRPERRAIERNEAQIEHWKRVEWPAIKKKRAAKSARSSSSTSQA